MDAATEEILLRLNREFYAEVADEFSQSRRRLQPGILRILDGLAASGDVLDLGCGDARVGLELRERGHTGRYVGVDFSEALLAQRPEAEGLERIAADLTASDWPDRVAHPRFDSGLCFSVLHHVPGRRLRLRVLRRLRQALRPGGTWAISVWQVLHRERFRRRRREWTELGVEESTVEAGDLLLDWSGGPLRYVHHFEKEELHELCAEAGLHIEESFRSDGDSDDLGLYLCGSA